MLSREQISNSLKTTLDEYGYSEKRVQERVWMNDKTSHAKTLSTQQITDDNTIEKFLVGSAREGISLLSESDSDWMQVNGDVICTDKSKNIKEDRNGRVIFRLDRRNAPAGYTYLRYMEQDRNAHPYFDYLKQALEESKNGVYLSSAKYMDLNEDVFYTSSGFIGRNTVYADRKGPSIPKKVKESKIVDWLFDTFDICRDMDFVRGFKCYCPSVLNNWIKSKRRCEWPNEETRVKVAGLPYHVVPVGVKGYKHEDLQWRMSFTMAEICLVRSFNETQRKMLILLRLIAKHILKPIAPDMTSYVIKNVAFWVAEKTPAHRFVNDQLFDRVIDAIGYLLTCVEKKRLPNYMMPERNVLYGKFTGKQQRELLIAKLRDLQVNGQMKLTNFFQSQSIEKDYPDLHNRLIIAEFHNYVDKLETLKLYPVSSAQLAAFCSFCFKCGNGSFYRLYTILFILMACIPTFGMKWFFEPLSIDLVEKAKEPQTFWYKYTVISRNKAKRKLLIKLERCSWFYINTSFLKRIHRFYYEFRNTLFVNQIHSVMAGLTKP